MTVPNGSIWGIGFSVSRPARAAVGSPKAEATAPWATSWKTTATRIGTATIATPTIPWAPGTIAGVYRWVGGCATKSAWGPVQCSRVLRTRCALPVPPDPVGRLERSRARPPPKVPGGSSAARALRALRSNAPAAPAARLRRPAGALSRSASAVSGREDRPLGPEPERRAPEVDEAPLVLEELAAGLLRFRGRERLLEVCAALPPELGHGVVGLLRAAALLQSGVDRVVQGVKLHVAPDAERLRVPADERAVGLVPVPLELLAREGRQAAEGKDELQHQEPPRASLDRGSSSRLNRSARAPTPSSPRASAWRRGRRAGAVFPRRAR